MHASGDISVSKKSNYKFRHAGRLLRNGAEFRILGGKMYEGTSTEQKAKNAKSGLDSMSKPLLQSVRQHNALLPPFTQRRLNSVCLIYMACFSPLYRQSENSLMSASGNFLFICRVVCPCWISKRIVGICDRSFFEQYFLLVHCPARLSFHMLCHIIINVANYSDRVCNFRF